MQTTTIDTISGPKNVTPIKLDPAWDQARELLGMGRQCASRLTAEIDRLREAYLHQGHGGARRGDQVSQSVKLETAVGFVAQLRDQLGLHPQQAARIEEAAAYQLRIERVAGAEIGEVIAWDEAGERKSLTVTAAHKECAEQVVDGLSLPGAPRPSRAWAGIVGEGTRVGNYGAGSMERAEPDHLGLWVKATHCIRRIAPRWSKLFPAGSGHQVRAVNELAIALAELPQSIRDEVFAAANAAASEK